MPSDSTPPDGTSVSFRGATFYKCALQVNPVDYGQRYRGRPSSGRDEKEHAKAIIDRAVELGIKVLAITDHNHIRGVTAFQDAAQGREIYIFPGFELSSKEGIHVLCLYPLDTDNVQLERYLGEFGIRNPQPSTAISNKIFTEILETVQSQGGITIAAHVTNNKGLFEVLNGDARIRAWKDKNLLAVQIPGEAGDLPQGSREIIENRIPAYKRFGTLDSAIAVVNAKDVVEPEDLEDYSATCWIKMSNVSIDGLRQAFLDPGSRIRLNPKNENSDQCLHSEIDMLGRQGGFLDRVQIHLNSNLNVLIGGRGTGKSTIVESIRAVLGLDPVGEDAKKVHRGIVRQVLQNGTKISMSVSVHQPTSHNYRIERVLPNPPLVYDRTGKIIDLAPTDILPNIEVYGQHEISELTKSPQKLIRLLDRFTIRHESLLNRKDSIKRKLNKNRQLLHDTSLEIKEIEEKLASLPGLEETLKRFKEAGLEETLREQSLLVREESVLNSIPERIQPFLDTYQSIQDELPIDRKFLSESALKDLPEMDILSTTNEIFTELEETVKRISDELKQSVTQANHRIRQIKSTWESRKQEVMAEYEGILRDLQKSRIDGEEFIQLRRTIEQLRPFQGRRRVLEKIEKECTTRREALIDEWEEVERELFDVFDQAAKEVNSKLTNLVEVRVALGNDRYPLFELLRDEIGGRLQETEKRKSLSKVPELSLRQFARNCDLGAEKLESVYGIPRTQAKRISGADVFRKIEELELTPTTTISLNTALKGECPVWKQLDELSTGQKATAVLLLLLLNSDEPLIIDQPEDDLDNRFISEGIIPRMREQKQRRQFIFSTHNANIPVLGDAEMIIGLSAYGNNGGSAHIADEHMGSIDSQPVRELVEEILEGGHEAFEIRRLKYGF